MDPSGTGCRDARGRFPFRPAPGLGPAFQGVDPLAPSFQAVSQDPVLSQVKLIAEPWEWARGGYQAGGFPVSWTEWNGRFRDTVREFWRGTRPGSGELGWRLTVRRPEPADEAERSRR